MCHNLLGPFMFSPNVNFIIGNNGTGKSAILTALIVGLGGKATATNRGISLKDFVKTGENSAEITVTLRNRGVDAYKHDVYGDCISVEHRVFTDGSRTCKLRSQSGRLVSSKKEELTSILDHFNIQLDNPVSILSQEMSKQFLHSKSESDKYKFFMKATLLEQMKRDYIHIKHTETVTRQQVETQEESLRDLKQDFLQKKEKFENFPSFSEMTADLENLKKQMAWSLVREKEQFVQQLKEESEREENNHKHQDNLQLCQTKVTRVEKSLQSVRTRVEEVNQELSSLSGERLRLKEQVKTLSKDHKEQELVYLRAMNKVKQWEQEQFLLQQKIDKARNSVNLNTNAETEYSRQQKRIRALKDQLAELECRTSQLNLEIKNQHQALFNGREERDKLRLEEHSVQVMCESKLRRKNQILSSRNNKLRRFGDRMPELLETIADEHAAGRFIKKPIGPIGACLTLKDPTLVVAVESCMRTFVKAFCCDSYEDEVILQELMTRYYPQGNRPQIIVSPFSDKVYSIHRRKANHPEYPSVLDVVTATSPVVINCLIDMRGIESILIIKEKDKARRIMQRGSPPKNCREAFTAEGDQVYPNRYYTSDVSTAKYLGRDADTELSDLESELENHKAQISRFQIQVNSVSEDITRMENNLNITVRNLKKTLLSMNEVKSALTELETSGQELNDDINSLEDVSRENELKMEEEKKFVLEAKLGLDEQQRAVDEVENKISVLRERMDHISEDLDTLKDEELKLDAEMTKQEQTLKVLEEKLLNHEDNVQAMKRDVAHREEELREFVAKAREICPDRQPVNRSTKSIDSDITQLKKKIQVYEKNHGHRDKVVREYAEALALYREKTNRVRDLRRFIDRLENIMSDRQNRYKILRRSLSVRCKLYFNNFLIKRNCSGSMIFDHSNETLAIAVKPPGQEDDSGVSDMRSLSGGERSFSTVCFMLSLWEITESPFRCLDEFDVYMDMHNRRISLDLLLELSERQHLRQFIFITPLNTSTLPKSRLINIHQLQDPEKDRSETTNQDV